MRQDAGVSGIRPRVTFLVTCYNQPAFIEEAIGSVLAQTYSPLEVIISDDHSTDGTYEKILASVEAYRGPHEVHVNRNPKNLAPGQVREIWHLATGDIWVLGHGDDVQHPDRVAVTVATMLGHGVSAVTCNPMIVDAGGNAVRPYLDPDAVHDLSLDAFFKQGWIPSVLGAGMAWQREVVDDFGPCLPAPRNVDNTLSFRALLMRGVHLVREPGFVRWRHHAGNGTLSLKLGRARDAGEAMKVQEQIYYNRVANFHSYLHDLETHVTRHPDDPRRGLLDAGRAQIEQHILSLTGQWVQHRLLMAKAKVIED
jgi:glycosyltransferase involved in cell wall biosynthesis